MKTDYSDNFSFILWKFRYTIDEPGVNRRSYVNISVSHGINKYPTSIT